MINEYENYKIIVELSWLDVMLILASLRDSDLEDYPVGKKITDVHRQLNNRIQSDKEKSVVSSSKTVEYMTELEFNDEEAEEKKLDAEVN